MRVNKRTTEKDSGLSESDGSARNPINNVDTPTRHLHLQTMDTTNWKSSAQGEQRAISIKLRQRQQKWDARYAGLFWHRIEIPPSRRALKLGTTLASSWMPTAIMRTPPYVAANARQLTFIRYAKPINLIRLESLLVCFDTPWPSSTSSVLVA